MPLDIHAKSEQILERLANSIFDRDPTNPNPLFFSITEIQIVEKWLSECLTEAKAHGWRPQALENGN